MRHKHRVDPGGQGRHPEGELDGIALGVDQHIGQDGYGIAPFHHALHMVEGLEKGRSFDSHPHIVAIL